MLSYPSLIGHVVMPLLSLGVIFYPSCHCGCCLTPVVIRGDVLHLLSLDIRGVVLPLLELVVADKAKATVNKANLGVTHQKS